MAKTGEERRLDELVGAGQLRFVYVLGLARSGSTIVAKLLGAALDGVVYEPATPAALDRRRHYARTILKAYDAARRSIGTTRPVLLAIKDLSLFIDEPEFEAMIARAAHVVVTVREPAAQQASLKTQLKHEFSIGQRIAIIFRHPFQALWMAWYFLVYGPRFVREASEALGYRFSLLPRLAMAGWNLRSWSNLESLLAQLRHLPVTIIDAGAMRRDPAATEARLTAIAASLSPILPHAGVEVAGHCRMLPGSKWAAEARGSPGIKPAGERPPPPLPDAFERALLALTEPAYARVLAAVPAERTTSQPVRQE